MQKEVGEPLIFEGHREHLPADSLNLEVRKTYLR